MPVVLHAFIGSRECPELTGVVAAPGQVRLIIVWAAIKDVETHPRAAKRRCQPDCVAVLVELPELPRVVSAAGQVGLVVVWTAVEDVQAHVLAAEEGRQPISAVTVRNQSPKLPGDVLIRLQSRTIVLRTAIEDVQLHSIAPEVRAELVVEAFIDGLGETWTWNHGEQRSDAGHQVQSVAHDHSSLSGDFEWGLQFAKLLRELSWRSAAMTIPVLLQSIACPLPSGAPKSSLRVCRPRPLVACCCGDRSKIQNISGLAHGA